MNIISVRRGFEGDHSSTHSEYIHGFTVTQDYDWWTCKFSIPYDEELFKKIAPYNASGDYSLWIKQRGDEIDIAISVHLDYGAVHPDDPYIRFADYCMTIKDNILAGDFSDLELLKVYVEGSKAEFRAMDSSSGIEDILDKVC
ncbi:MAG: hypothetical protein FJ014_10775 [Chloroflexi bacterium]|nr:hypothetical protein [Chloroflexota bacterium]